MKRVLIGLLFALGLSVPGWAQGIPYNNVAFTLNNMGEVIPAGGAQIDVCQPTDTGLPCTNHVSIFSDAAMAHQITQPFFADLYGNFNLYAATCGPFVYTVTGATVLPKSYPINPCGNGGAINPSSLNGIIFVDGVTYKLNDVGLSAACTAAGSSGTVGISKPIVLGGNVTCNSELRFFTGGTIATTGWTLTSNGQIFAPAVQIFIGTGTLTLAPEPLSVSWFPGATSDAQITNCLAAIPSGGICDATKYGNSTQSFAATVTTSAGQELLFNPATLFQAASASLNLFTVGVNSHIDGFHFDCGNQPSYTGTLFTFNQNYRNGNSTTVEHIRVTCHLVSGGNAAFLTANGLTQSIAFLGLRHWRQYGLNNGILLSATGNGFINGNQFVDMEWSGQNSAALHYTTNNGQLNGNICDPCSFEQDGLSNTAELFDGTTGANDQESSNQWIGDIWDTTTAITYTNTKALGNIFQGRMDGTISDPQNQNLVNDSIAKVLNFPGTTISGDSVTAGDCYNCTNDKLAMSRGSSAPARRGITWGADPLGDITFWTNGNQNSPNWIFKDGNLNSVRATLFNSTGLFQAGSFGTNSNCQLGGAAGTTSPAACGSAAAGMIAIPASQTTYTINTTAVTANSEIRVTQVSDNSGLPSSPTCNATASNPMESARVAGTSFTFTLASVANVTCYHYEIKN